MKTLCLNLEPLYHDSIHRFSCATRISEERKKDAEKHFSAKRVGLSRSREVAKIDSVVIPVFWHVISKDGTEEGGNIADRQIKDSISVLNSDFAGSGLSFSLVLTDRTVNETWFNDVNGRDEDPDAVQKEMKEALALVGSPALNIYSVGFTNDPDDTLGYATLPEAYADNPIDDGVVIRYTTLPGGSLPNFNLGKVCGSDCQLPQISANNP